MNKKSKISLRTSFSFLFGLQVIMIIALGILIILLYQNQKNLAQSRDRHFNSYLLADELRQSSDDLTRMVRAYVATGDEEYEKEYWAVLDIRNGVIPRPVKYNHIYWDFYSAQRGKPREDGETISLQDLMIEEGFTNEELALLTEAQEKSDYLVQAETIAMNAMKGKFQDENGDFTITGEPDQAFASELVNNQAYYDAKADIMKPIDEFYHMFEERTTSNVEEYLQRSQRLIFGSINLTLGILIIFIISFIIVSRQISQRQKAENEIFQLNQNLESQVEERTKNLKESEENLRNTIEKMQKFNEVMVGRELKMIELKKEIQNLKDKMLVKNNNVRNTS